MSNITGLYNSLSNGKIYKGDNIIITMVFYVDLSKHFKKGDIITTTKVKELLKITYPSAKLLILENEINGIVERDELGKEGSKRQISIWRLK